MTSDFRPIPGHPGYFVNREGTVKTSTGRVLPHSSNTNGKPRVVLVVDTYRRTSRDVRLLVGQCFPELGIPQSPHARRLNGTWVAR